MELRMDGRVALITGGSDGLGRAMAHAFSASGASVAIAAREQEKLNSACDAISQATGHRIEAYAADVSDAGQIAALYDKVTADLGQVDILVNNAVHRARHAESRMGPHYQRLKHGRQGTQRW